MIQVDRCLIDNHSPTSYSNILVYHYIFFLDLKAEIVSFGPWALNFHHFILTIFKLKKKKENKFVLANKHGVYFK